MRYCQLCNNQKKEDYCSQCRSVTPNHYRMSAFTLQLKLNLEAVSMIHKRPGIKGFLKKVTVGHKNSQDFMKYPDGVFISRIIDKEKNFYQEKVTDIATGILVRNVSEPLSEHTPSRNKNKRSVDGSLHIALNQ